MAGCPRWGGASAMRKVIVQHMFSAAAQGVRGKRCLAWHGLATAYAGRQELTLPGPLVLATTVEGHATQDPGIQTLNDFACGADHGTLPHALCQMYRVSGPGKLLRRCRYTALAWQRNFVSQAKQMRQISMGAPVFSVLELVWALSVQRCNSRNPGVMEFLLSVPTPQQIGFVGGCSHLSCRKGMRDKRDCAPGYVSKLGHGYVSKARALNAGSPVVHPSQVA